MYVKKSISLLLSGALFASLCTGCSQTTMEHHFFTDTETETEINTEVVGANLPEIEELQTFLSSKDIELEVFLNSDGIAGSQAPAGSGAGVAILTDWMIEESLNNTSVSSETLSEGIKDSMYYLFCCSGPYEESNLTTFLSDTKNAINRLCDAFKGLQEDDFTNLKNELEKNDGREPNLVLTVSNLRYSENDQYYVVVLLTKMSNGWIEWK